MAPPSPSGHPHHPILGCLPGVTQPWEPRQEMGAFRQKPEQMQLITCSRDDRKEREGSGLAGGMVAVAGPGLPGSQAQRPSCVTYGRYP